MSAQLQQIREIMTVDDVEPVEGDPIAEQLQKLDEAINIALSKLSARQEKFVLEYAKCGNGAEAAIGAGYSERTAKTIANQHLTKLDLKQAVTLLSFRHQLRTGISGDYKRRALLEVYQRSMAQDSPDTAGACRAIDLLNKMDGSYVVRLEDVFEDGEDELGEMLSSIEGEQVIQVGGEELLTTKN